MTLIRQVREQPVRPRARVFVLTDPTGAFEAVRLRPLWGILVVVVLLAAALPKTVFVARADLDTVVSQKLQKSERIDVANEQILHEAQKRGAAALSVLLPAGAVAKRSFGMTLTSLLVFGLLRIRRPSLTLAPVAGAVGLAMAPLMVHDVLSAAVFATADPAALWAIDAQNAVLSNPAAWWGLDSTHSTAAALLRGLDFFALWSVGLVAVGVNRCVGLSSKIPGITALCVHLGDVLLGIWRVH